MEVKTHHSCCYVTYDKAGLMAKRPWGWVPSVAGDFYVIKGLLNSHWQKKVFVHCTLQLKLVLGYLVWRTLHGYFRLVLSHSQPVIFIVTLCFRCSDACNYTSKLLCTYFRFYSRSGGDWWDIIHSSKPRCLLWMEGIWFQTSCSRSKSASWHWRV